MSFKLIANDLLKQAKVSPISTPGGGPPKKENIIEELNSAGFSRREVLTMMAELYTDPDTEPPVKKQLLQMLTQMHGMLQSEEVLKVVPNISLTIVNGNESRLSDMICPQVEEVKPEIVQ